MKLESAIVLLPPSRTRIHTILRFGFRPDGEVITCGQRFYGYRFQNPGEASRFLGLFVEEDSWVREELLLALGS